MKYAAFHIFTVAKNLVTFLTAQRRPAFSADLAKRGQRIRTVIEL
jgi:hypothetical protein